MNIRAIFNSKKNVFHLSFEDETGIYSVELPSTELARVLEYLELVLASYNERRDNHRKLHDEKQEP